jgi:hypothetical protein
MQQTTNMKDQNYAATKAPEIRLVKRSPEYWRVTFDHPPLNLSQFEVGVGLVPGGGPMARLSRLMGRGRALEVILSADDVSGDLAERYEQRIKTLIERGFCKPGDAENRLGDFVGR